jgi:protein-disulfide isomerase
MRQISTAILLSLTLLLFSSGAAQTPESRQEEQLLALVKELQAQQVQIADNLAKIDVKLAEVAETIRVARIYSKRER